MTIKTFQFHVKGQEEIIEALSSCPFEPQLIITFGCKDLLASFYNSFTGYYLKNKPVIIGATTAGEIYASEIYDSTLSLQFLKFEKTTIYSSSVCFTSSLESENVGKMLASSLLRDNLSHVFILSEGLNINGSKLVEGLRGSLPDHVSITGGLAGDSGLFNETLVLSDTGLSTNKVAAIGFYGNNLSVGFGSLGGWDPFGPERVITKSEHNILYELDGKPALPLYKEYLGDLAKDLPASGLLFPLTICVPGNYEPLVRTLLSIDENTQSLTFAGDIPQSCRARLMKANTDRLIDGAAGAANIASVALDSATVQFAILISCVGRRILLKQRCEDEIDAVKEHLGSNTPLVGFYSYGEIAPFIKHARCELHNQTMTITTFLEN